MRRPRFNVSPETLRDLHVYIGVTAVAFGVGLVWVPGFYVVMGVALAGLGLFAGRLS